MTLFPRNALEEIEANWKFKVSGVEIDDIIRPPGRNVIEDIVRKITVLIDQPHPATGPYVLKNQTAQERQFTRAGFSDAITG